VTVCYDADGKEYRIHSSNPNVRIYQDNTFIHTITPSRKCGHKSKSGYVRIEDKWGQVYGLSVVVFEAYNRHVVPPEHDYWTNRSKYVIDHINNKKDDNSVANLQLLTVRKNISKETRRKREKNGSVPAGIDMSNIHRKKEGVYAVNFCCLDNVEELIDVDALKSFGTHKTLEKAIEIRDTVRELIDGEKWDYLLTFYKTFKRKGPAKRYCNSIEMWADEASKLDKETCRWLEWAPMYYAKSDGHIYSLKDGSRKNERLYGDYLKIDIAKKNYFVHKIIYEAFNGPACGYLRLWLENLME
jgi:hypothetical protein